MNQIFLKKHFITLAVSLVANCSFAAPATIKTESVYTDLDQDCVTISAANENAQIDFFEAECKSFGGYSLSITGSDLRYHPALRYGDQAIPLQTPFTFHDVSSSKIEWVYQVTLENDGYGQVAWKGLIYRLSYTDFDSGVNMNPLYVVRLNGEDSCFLGTTTSNVKAREMALDPQLKCH